MRQLRNELYSIYISKMYNVITRTRRFDRYFCNGNFLYSEPDNFQCYI